MLARRRQLVLAALAAALFFGWTVDAVARAARTGAGAEAHGAGLSTSHGADTGIVVRTPRMTTPCAVPVITASGPSHVGEAPGLPSPASSESGPPLYTLLRVYRL